MAFSKVILLVVITVCLPSIRAQTVQPTAAQLNDSSPGVGRYLFPGVGRYVFPAWLSGVVVTPVQDVEVLQESYARAVGIRKPVVTDFEVADCSTAGDAMVKETTTVYCPAGCASRRKATVWGTGVYKGDSSLCRAAIHSGKLQDVTGGFVTVSKRPMGMMFPGSTRNRVKSTFIVINSKSFPKLDMKSFVVKRYEFGK
ncbi:CRISPLD2 [Branchiostoma lanceolatum]|uniref:CRISPLD2 protein n=1 Tax=Branchiostoma lanceolatum TaxID=7740 RepID=A0A8J9W151_BRALA|nr:CRISPLD2 [Branchiostoma lanceolatum]